MGIPSALCVGPLSWVTIVHGCWQGSWAEVVAPHKMCPFAMPWLLVVGDKLNYDFSYRYLPPALFGSCQGI